MKRFLIPCAVLAAAAVLGGCAKNADTGGEDLKFGGYPVDTSVELVYWTPLNQLITGFSTDLAGTEFAKRLHEKTGVKVKYQHPPQGQEKDQLNILLASKSLPDIIEYDWSNFPGGIANAYEQEFVIALNDLIDSDSPNYKKYLAEHPLVNLRAKTDDGKYLTYPMINGDDKLRVFNGPFVRKDWLDDLDLPVPETLDNWHTMLTRFKNEKGAVSPLAYNSSLFVSYMCNGNFLGAYGILENMYYDGASKKFSFGAIKPEYKEFLELYAQWYKEGLIDKNISNIDGNMVNSNILNGKTGASIGFAGSGIGTLASSAETPGFKLTAVPYPVKVKGQRPKFGQKESVVSSQGNAAITTSCKYPKLAARFLDYGYSEDGYNLNNFGTEGVSYDIIDGYPTYSGMVIRNPDGLGVASAIAKYARSSYFGPFVKAKEYIEQYYLMPEQQDAMTVWSDTDQDFNTAPPLSFTNEENGKIADVMSNVNTYVDEYTLKVIIGAETTAGFDTYVKQVEAFGIRELENLYQGKLDAYLAKNP